MSLIYTPGELKVLRESPLVKKPSSLPPAEQWMGPPPDPTRNPPNERAKNYDSDLILDQPNKRPGAERHVSRNSANPEDIILGPPKTSFMSATSIRSTGKTFDSLDRTPTRDTGTRDRFDFRSKNGDGDHDRARDGRNNNLRVRRTDGDQDSDGWSTVKPRKSFGNEGAERFNGRMGLDRHKDDRRFKDREDRDVKDRPPRGFDTYARDKDPEDQERDGRRNGTGRGRNEPSWFKDNGDGPAPSKDRNSNGDKFMDRSRGWREKEREDKEDRGGDRNERGDRRERGDRGNQRWDRERDQRQERDPEWMDEPQEEKTQAHTQEEFEKWKSAQRRNETMGKDKSIKTPVDNSPPDNGGGFFGLESPAQKVETPLAIDTGPDKFFGKWATPKDEISPDSGVESRKEGLTKAKTTGKASRFTSFFTPQEEPARRQTEPPPPMSMQQQGGLEAMFAGAGTTSSSQSNAEKEAFQMLLQKLQINQPSSQSGSTPPPNAGMQYQKPPLVQEKQQHIIPISTPEPFQQYRADRHGEGRQPVNSSHQAVQDLLAQRQIANSQPALRDQMMHDLGGQRQNAMSQASIRSDHSGRNTNSQSEFLMGLMKAAPDPQRSEQVLLRMQTGQKERHMQQQHQQQQQMMMEREQEMQQREAAQRERERSASQRQIRQPPPGFYDHEPQQQVFQRGPPPQHERQPGNPMHPTQILQRPGPPGLGPDIGWDRPTQQLPPQHRISNIPPPPGLGANGPNRAMPMPQQMFPPGFPMGNFPPPEGMPGPPRMGPGGFFGAPPQAPPGFLPPGMNGFPGPEGMAFGGPFDGRGPPPQGNFRRQ